MSNKKRFWMPALKLTAALFVLLLAYALLVHFTSDSYRGAGGLVLGLHSVPRQLGLFFPLITFFAALGVGLKVNPIDRVHDVPPFVAAPITAGAAAYLWLAFVEPGSRVAIFRWSAELAGAPIDPAPVASTQTWLAAQLSNPQVDLADERFFTWLFHLPNAMGLLTALLCVVGFLLGRRAATGAHRWTMAALVTAIIAPAVLGSLRLSTRYDVPAEVTTYGMLLIPLLLLAVLLWIGWTDRQSSAPVAIS